VEVEVKHQPKGGI